MGNVLGGGLAVVGELAGRVLVVAVSNSTVASELLGELVGRTVHIAGDLGAVLGHLGAGTPELGRSLSDNTEDLGRGPLAELLVLGRHLGSETRTALGSLGTDVRELAVEGVDSLAESLAGELGVGAHLHGVGGDALVGTGNLGVHRLSHTLEGNTSLTAVACDGTSLSVHATVVPRVPVVCGLRSSGELGLGTAHGVPQSLGGTLGVGSDLLVEEDEHLLALGSSETHVALELGTDSLHGHPLAHTLGLEVGLDGAKVVEKASSTSGGSREHRGSLDDIDGRSAGGHTLLVVSAPSPLECATVGSTRPINLDHLLGRLIGVGADVHKHGTDRCCSEETREKLSTSHTHVDGSSFLASASPC